MIKFKLFSTITTVASVIVIILVIVIHSWTATPYGRLDPRVAILLKYMKAADIELFREGKSLEESRKIGNSAGILRSKPGYSGEIRNISIPRPGGTIPVRIYIPGKQGHYPVVVYYHGGGWFMGNLDTHDSIPRQISEKVPALCISVDYRLAPENRFPAAADDCYTALLWAHDNAASFGGDPSRIAVMGDSAGGNLAAVTAITARNRKGPLLVMQVLDYPVVDESRMDTPSCKMFAKGYYLTVDDMKKFRSMYAPDPKDWTNPRLSPLLEPSLKGLPQAVVLTAEFDVLRDEGEAFAKRLKESGVPVVHQRIKGVLHGFMGMDRILPQATDATKIVVGELRKAFGEK